MIQIFKPRANARWLAPLKGQIPGERENGECLKVVEFKVN